jgi:hypothetical protein
MERRRVKLNGEATLELGMGVKKSEVDSLMAVALRRCMRGSRGEGEDAD